MPFPDRDDPTEVFSGSVRSVGETDIPVE